MKKSRKKILLSSIAMLLVALVALGSATFAWFTINKEVTANGMKVKAATAAGLQITKVYSPGTNDWARDVTFGKWGDATGPDEAVLSPVSIQYANGSALGANGFYTTDAKNDGAYTSEDIGTKSGAGSWKAAPVPSITTNDNGEAKNKTGYFAAYRVGIRSSGDNDIENVKMTLGYTPDEASAATNKSSDFIRVVVIDNNDSGKVVANYGEGAANTKPIKNATPTVDTAGQAADKLEVTGITAPKATSSAQYYTVIVWFEGQDQQCDDDHQALSGAINLKFEMTGV